MFTCLISTKKLIFSFITFLIITLFVAIPSIYASNFSHAYIRLDNMTANSPLSGVVCAQPSSPSTGTENSVAITFPTDFTINSITSNWTADTNNIPSGTTAWPGISSSATQIAGNTVTFSSNDLTSATTYCFTFTGTSSTTGSIGNKTGTLTTKSATNTTIDTAKYGVTIRSSDQITVNASVGAHSTDLLADLTQITPGSIFTHDNFLEYTLAYKTTLPYAATITVQASWSKGTIHGTSAATEDILEYVIGSATKGYNNTPPVIDTQNRTITWTIPNFPGNTSGSVFFKFKTTNTFTADDLVTASITGNITSQGSQSLNSSKTIRYLYHIPNTSTSTSTSTSNPTPTPSPTPMPTSNPATFSINSLTLRTISSQKVSIDTTLSEPGTVTAAYGTSLNTLTKSVSTLQIGTHHTITIDNLQPATQYYFRLTAHNSSGERVISDIFTFTTAQVSQPPQIVRDSIIVSTQDNIIYNPNLFPKILTAIIGQNSIYKITLKVNDSVSISSVKTYLANPYVLGINNFSPMKNNVSSTELARIAPNVYSGSLRAPSSITRTSVIAHIEDVNGNIIEEPIFVLQSIPNFTVRSQSSHQPIEAAQIYLWSYDPQTQLYSPLSHQSYNITNPSFTESNGQLILPLSPGTYKAEITSIGYAAKTVEFTLGGSQGQGFPIVYLHPTPFSIISFIQYYTAIIRDTSHTTLQFAHTLISSNRFLVLLSVASLFALSFLLIYAVSLRLQIAVIHLPSYIWYHLKTLLLPTLTHETIITGKIVDIVSGASIAHATIHLKNASTHLILAHTQTDSLGEFYAAIHHPINVKLDVAKDGYVRFHSPLFEASSLNSPLLFKLTPQKQPERGFIFLYFWHIKQLIKDSVEVFIILSLFMEIFVGLFFSWLAILPHLIISLASFVLWLSYIKKTLLYSEQQPLKS